MNICNRMLVVSCLAALFIFGVRSSGLAQGEKPSVKQERDLIAILKSDKPDGEKALACKFLSVYGTGEAVPELAKLLSNERLASWARIALEAIPGATTDE